MYTPRAYHASGRGIRTGGDRLALRLQAGELRVQVVDFVYQLVQDGPQPAVILNHGAMQVDAFPTRPTWTGNAVRFDDDEKRVRYEVQVSAPIR
jgi:hypothetical protein